MERSSEPVTDAKIREARLVLIGLSMAAGSGAIWNADVHNAYKDAEKTIRDSKEDNNEPPEPPRPPRRPNARIGQAAIGFS